MKLLFDLFLRKKSSIYSLIAFHFSIRVLIALLTNLSVDEAYYVNYALYPAWSYFDHPPMVSCIIRLSTFNLYFLHSDFFIRFGAIVVGSFNLWLVYQIGLLLRDRATGLIAALLMSASFYASIISGTFILPDTGLSLCWLLSLFFFLKFIASQSETKWLFVFGMAVGLAMLSKYHALFLWIGAGGYFLFFDSKKLLDPRLWLSIGISLLIFSPVIFWNLTSPYSGIGYHAHRVGNDSRMPSLGYFFPEFFGQIFYNNPLNVALILLTGMAVFKSSQKLSPTHWFLLFTSIPLVLTTLGMSLFNQTLPHWSGPSYFGFILLAAISFPLLKDRVGKGLMIAGQLFYLSVIALALIQINFAPFIKQDNQQAEMVGRNDFTTDLAIWPQIATNLEQQLVLDSNSNISAIISDNFFPAGHLDYYFAQKMKLSLYVFGTSDRQHEYRRINKLRGKMAAGSSAYYITISQYYSPLPDDIRVQYDSVSEPIILPSIIHETNRENVFVWRLEKLKEKENFLDK